MTTKVLIIEDEACLRQSLSIMLWAEGYDVLGAEDGSIGVDLARIEMPDVVICDLRMPRLNGDKVLDLLRQDPCTAKIPFIFISADDLSLAPEIVKSVGHENFLRKPFSRNELLEAIARNQREAQPIEKNLATGQFYYPNPTKIQNQHCPC